MDVNQTPTKSNLMKAQASLKMAEQGYDLLDKKRRLLLRELSTLEEQKKKVSGSLAEVYNKAYMALQTANISAGIDSVQQYAKGRPTESNINIKNYSVMGVEVPVVRIAADAGRYPAMSLYNTNLSLDEARVRFEEAKKLTLRLAELDSGIARLSSGAGKTQKRANALKNIMIPKYTALIREISSSLEEKEREEFSRLKVLKKKA